MKYETEITVEVGTSLEELIRILKDKKFKLTEIYDLNDIYMVNKGDRGIIDPLNLLNKCIILRHLIEKDSEKKMIVYKHKEYNSYGEITKQGKLKCIIDDINKAKELFEDLNFEELLRINDHIMVYSDGVDELVIQSVNDKHIYIEIEDDNNYTGRDYKDVEEMKEVIRKIGIPIKGNDFFVKKAQIELIEKNN